MDKPEDMFKNFFLHLEEKRVKDARDPNVNRKVKVEYENKRIEEIDEKDLIRSLMFDDKNDVMERINYKEFELIVNGKVHGEELPFVVSHYNGYIKYVGDHEDIKTKMNEIFAMEEVETLVHYGWTGGFEDAIGFDCAHAGDIRINKSLKKLMEMSPEDIKNLDPVDLYTSKEYAFFGDDRETFKSREYLFEMLRSVADKTMEIYERDN
jgi:hypothetical protein